VPTDIIMPQLGESIAEGTIIKWLVPAGGRVEKDQPLLEVETDKVSLEVPSPTSGFLTEVLVAEGQKVPVGTLIARLEGEARKSEVINRVGGVVVRSMEPSPEGVDHYSPAVRQLAKEHGVDLAGVKGTGFEGRVTKKDVLDFVAPRGGSQKAPPQKAAPTAQPSPPAAGADEILPFTQMRKTIAERMVKSRQTSAHVCTFFEADFSGIARFREGRSGEGKSLTYLPFVVSAVARALKDMPVVNSSWGDQGIVIKKDIHMGIAVALEDGLLVPVVRNPDRKTLSVLAKEVADLADRARTKRLNPEEVQGGTFTITNHGGFGSLFSAPIIHQPQIAIMGVGAVQKRPVVINDAIAIRPMAYLSLSFDHRVIDGATADQFMSKVKGYLEQSQWDKLL
jgi:2-oxoglutarate dehydrogenase E2 component (dihydrolipoamide succinyltransferase)/2-oxoisovalerate dehydrogenase E2 component (dihydrolipoyl transacylase)